MSLSKPIPLKQREEMEHDKFMGKCCIRDNNCFGSIQWHHNLKWKGERSNKKEHIMPVCEWHHNKADTTEVRERIDWAMLSRLSEQQIKEISKAVNYKQRLLFLVTKYGEYKN